MNYQRMASIIGIPVASAAILLGAGGIANAATPTPVGYSEGAVNIDLTITNNSGEALYLSSAQLAGTDQHWDQRPAQLLAPGAAEEVTGYSHVLTDGLYMEITYNTPSGDLASFDVQAHQWTGNGTTGTGVEQADGTPSTDLATSSSVTSPAGVWDHAVATASIQPTQAA